MNKWQVGDRIGGRFEVNQIFGGEGKSGMGIVYICYDHQSSKLLFPVRVALKTFQERYILSEEFQESFKKEAFLWMKLEKHPYIVHAYWVENIEGRLFVILEYVASDNGPYVVVLLSATAVARLPLPQEPL